MYILTTYTPFMVTPGEDFETIEDCEHECERRYKVKGLKFLRDGDVWRALVPGEEGVIVLKLTEAKDDN